MLKICRNKGQINVEYFVSILAFIVFAMYILFQLIGVTPLYLNEVDREILRSEAYQLSEILVNDAGSPSNWETYPTPSTILLRMGLSDETQNKTNLLSMAKVSLLDSLCDTDYNQVASWLDTYDYFSITIIESTTSTVVANCQPPTGTAVGLTNMTVRRVVSFDSGDYGELILNVW